MLSLKNIKKSFGASDILQDISLEVDNGTCLSILGPSGCGKTTLLRIIAGLEEPDAGDIYLNGKSLADCSPGKRDVALVFQNYSLYSHRTVFDNLAYPLRVRKLNLEEIEERVIDAAKLLKIVCLLKRFPETLSGGEQQRVALGRALVRKPKLFLLDEPLSHLDGPLRSEMQLELRKLYDIIGVPVIHVTHDHNEAMLIADKIAILDDGNLLQIGSAVDLVDDPQSMTVARIMGEPRMNFIPGEIEGDKVNSNTLTINICEDNGREAGFAQNSEKENGHMVMVGIRPWNFMLTPPSDNSTLILTAQVKTVIHFPPSILLNMVLVGQQGEGTNEITILLDVGSNISEGHQVKLYVSYSNIHIFDLKTGGKINISLDKVNFELKEN